MIRQNTSTSGKGSTYHLVILFFQILLLAIFVAAILRKPEEESDKEEQNKALYEIQLDEICAAQTTGKCKQKLFIILHTTNLNQTTLKNSGQKYGHFL